MYTHLFIAIDGSVLAHGALEQGVALAKNLEAKVTIVTVTEPWQSVVVGDAIVGFPIDEYEKASADSASQILTKAKSVAIEAGVDCETVHVKDSYPADGIIDTAKKHGCDLIVMASHGHRGITRLLLGIQANHVVTRSTVPVLICR